MPKKPRNKSSLLLSLLAYGLTLLLVFFQIPSLSEGDLPPQGLTLLNDLLSSRNTILAITAFFISVTVINLLPVAFILAIYRRDPRAPHSSSSKFVSTGIGYVLLWHLLALVINSMLFPYSDWAPAFYFNSNIYLNLALISSISVVLFFLLARVEKTHNFHIIRIGLAAIAISFCLSFISKQHVLAANHTNKPDIIIIGIDSFSAQQYQAYKKDLPNIRKFVDNSVQFVDTVTPLGRTFTAWSSILSGKYPQETGARDNLTPLRLINSKDFLPTQLHSYGYETIYAIDERQFSNIDESWGFDKIIGPKVGVSDFIISKLSDIPAVNIFVAALPSIAEKLFPYTTYNRAAWKLYNPKRFSDKLDKELLELNNQPLFLSIHFCIAHSPFKWGKITDYHNEVSFDKIGTKAHYKAIRAADEQFGRLINTLERTGRLSNAIVVVLSDHGEGLGYKTREFSADLNIPSKNKRPHKSEIVEFAYGHGSNLNEPEINQVLLSINQYKHGKAIFHSSRQYEPAVLIDVAPTVLQLANLNKGITPGFTGISLAPIMNGHGPELTKRTRFMETGLSPGALNAEAPSPNELMKAVAGYFRINKNGRVELDMELYEEIEREKRVAIIQGDWQLTLYPKQYVGATQVLFNRVSGHWTDDVESPLWHEANADWLYDQLVSFFKNSNIDAIRK
jgi:arylsulfatase A-like enzyme